MAMMSMNFGVPFIPYFIQELGVGDPEKLKIYTALSAALPAAGMGLSAPLWGILADRHGRKLMLVRAVFMAGLIFFALSISANVTQLLIFRLCQGIFTGTVSASSAFVASNTPDENLSWSFGMLASARFIGIMAGPAIGGMIAEGFGYRTSFMLGGIMMIVNGFLIYIFLKEKKIIKTVKKEKHTGALSSVRFLLKPSLIIILAMLFVLMMSRAVFSPYLALFVQEIRGTLEGSSRATGLISAFIAMMTAVSSILIGRAGSKMKKTDIVHYSLLAGIAVSLFLTTGSSLLFFAAFYGMTMFSVAGVEPILLTLASEKVPSEKRGSLFGYVSMLTAFGWMFSSAIGSFISIRFSISTILYAIPVFLAVIFLLKILYVKKSSETEAV